MTHFGVNRASTFDPFKGPVRLGQLAAAQSTRNLTLHVKIYGARWGHEVRTVFTWETRNVKNNRVVHLGAFPTARDKRSVSLWLPSHGLQPAGSTPTLKAEDGRRRSLQELESAGVCFLPSLKQVLISFNNCPTRKQIVNSLGGAGEIMPSPLTWKEKKTNKLMKAVKLAIKWKQHNMGENEMTGIPRREARTVARL